jgi:ATP phosphoribosyltransferase
MNKLKIMLPKGRIFEKVVKLMSEAGVYIEMADRVYRPNVSDPEIEIKIMKPQNIPQLIELGAHDIGFTGYDWIIENNSKVEEIMDLRFDPVKIIAAIPEHLSEKELKKKQIVVASEYENLSRTFLEKEKFNYVFLRTYGATEVFPPDDADMIVDNSSTGRTLETHGLKIIATVLKFDERSMEERKDIRNENAFQIDT